MVERIKITPSQILLKDADGNIKFNTDYAYIKTGGGTLYAGGYQRAPAIYGQNSVTDHASEGWYTPGLFSGTVPVLNQNWIYYWNVPKANQAEFRILPDGSANVEPMPFSSTTTKTLKYFNYDTRVLSDTSITYKWHISRYGINPSTDGDGNTYYQTYQWRLYPVFSSNTFPEVTNPSGGTYETTLSANEHASMQRVMSYTDEWGTPYSVTQYAANYYLARTTTDGDGYTVQLPAETIYWRPNGVFTKRNTVALSLAVTP